MPGVLSTLKLPQLPPFVERILRKIHLLPTPPPSPLRPNEAVWLYDNIAFRSPTTGKWTVQFIAAYFYRNTGADLAKIVADIVGKIGIVGDSSEQTEKVVAERVQPFLDTVLEGRTVEVDFGAGQQAPERLMLGPGGDMGVSVNDIEVKGSWKDGDVVGSNVVQPAIGLLQTCSLTRFETRFADEEGWAVVSDIDDTVKISEVRDRTSLLRHTFALPPTPVEGMPAAYSRLSATLKNPPFFYLSASPYNLYPLLSNFINQHYPRGQLLLREMSWQELSSFIATLTLGTQAYKEHELEILLKNFPKRKWVFVGDSTQTDPEAYAATYRKFPDRIGRIWIRVVKGVNEQDEKTLNGSARFEKAFKGVPESVWGLFEDPEVLANEVEVFAAT